MIKGYYEYDTMKCIYTWYITCNGETVKRGTCNTKKELQDIKNNYDIPFYNAYYVENDYWLY